jgi:hypothetical protein
VSKIYLYSGVGTIFTNKSFIIRLLGILLRHSDAQARIVD